MKAMNVIGIDHQLSVTTIALREARTTVAGTRVVGDGWYPIIHNCVSADPEATGKYLLGTSAMSLGDSVADLAYDQIKTVEAFWSAVARVLYNYLGRTMPVEANGYRMVMAPGVGVDASTALSAMRRAGLSTVEVITPGEALLARRVASTFPSERASRVVVIAAGDSATTVQAFEMEEHSGNQPRIVQRSDAAEITGHGDLVWRNHLLALLLQNHIESPAVPLNRNPRVLASLGRLAIQLGSEPDSLLWDGCQSRLFSPVVVKRNLSMWPELHSFELEVRAAITQASRIFEGTRPQELLVGGIGAEWPFLRDIVSGVGPIHQSTRPSEDLATGCCWAEVLNQPDAGSGRSLAEPQPELSSATTRPLLPAAASSDLPPWQRRDFDLGLSEELE